MNEERAKQNTMTPEFMATARRAVASSVVLLKNDNDLLPILKESGKTIALIGPMIKDSINLNGEWAGLGDRNQSLSIFNGLNEKYKNSSVNFIYSEGSSITETTPSKIDEAVATANKADIIIAAVGKVFIGRVKQQYEPIFVCLNLSVNCLEH